MNTKLKNALIKVFTYLLSGSGMVVIMVFQYFSNKNPMPTWAKITVPCLIALLIFFLVYYQTLTAKINRKLTAIETAKELGQAGKTNSVVANLLETIGVVIPVALIGGIFIVGGQYLVKTGVVLFEMLAMYVVVIIGNVICDMNTKEELKKQQREKAEEFAEKVASKIENLPKKYE